MTTAVAGTHLGVGGVVTLLHAEAVFILFLFRTTQDLANVAEHMAPKRFHTRTQLTLLFHLLLYLLLYFQRHSKYTITSHKQKQMKKNTNFAAAKLEKN